MGFYSGKVVLVTGAKGFIAWNLVDHLLSLHASVRAVDLTPPPADYPEVDYRQADLSQVAQCRRVLEGVDYVFHLAAVGWGLHENLKRQPELLTRNILLNTTLLQAAYEERVKRYLYTSSSAVYPAHKEELHETDSWGAPPHSSEECFGWAKRIGEIQARAYWQHYGMQIAIVRPSNPYGPHDNFHSLKSHVIPALIRRAVAREEPFVVWGSGRPVRSFIFVSDVVKGMLLALEHYACGEAVNLASPEAVNIVDLVRLVLDLTGHASAQVEFRGDMPEGHPRKILDVCRAREKLGMTEFVPLREGLRKTLDWYLENRPIIERG